MNMELQEEIMVGMGIQNNSNAVVADQTHIAKGKRTKRQRPQSPAIVPMTTSSSSGVGNRGGGGGGGCGSVVDRHVASPTTSIGYTGSTTEEEEDMANCLIMLAKGYVGGGDSATATGSKQMMVTVAVVDQEDDHHIQVDEKFNSRKFTEAATTTGKAGFYVYECKTCNRCFPSFQALGGHRASHKKPKALQEAAEKKALQLVLTEDEQHQFLPSALQIGNQNRSANNSLFSHSNIIINNSSNNNKSKVHECSICGSEFSSGQALGGHMRRHRTTPTAAAATTSATNPVLAAESHHRQQHQEPMINNKQRNVLSLDLNLPAPEEEHREPPKFSFANTKQNLVFSASALVDCHY